MDGLVTVPHEEGLSILEDELYERIQRFELIDSDDNVYYESSIHASYFDGDGVLTVTLIIPKENHFTVWNKAVRIKSDDGLIIADILTPAIQFVKGVGGTQEVKLAVSGEAGVINFKADEYITVIEANELFLKPLVANTNLNIALQNNLIDKQILLAVDELSLVSLSQRVSNSEEDLNEILSEDFVNKGQLDEAVNGIDLTVKANKTEVLGIGQTWQNMTANRAGGITYTNINERPIAISIDHLFVGTAYGYLTVDGVRISSYRITSNGNWNIGGSLYAIVPAGSRYRAIFYSYAGISWYELI